MQKNIIYGFHSIMEAVKAKPESEATTVSAPPQNTLTEQEKSEGWTLLFDGQSKAGWHVYNAVSDGSAWMIDSGTLHLDPRERI